MNELTRFAQRLVEQLGSNGGTVHRPVTIAALRETILPYRSHRKALGLSSVEDYETVLLRLIAEEGGYVKTVPAAAAERCREILAGTIPDLGVLDEVADSTIQVTSIVAGRILSDERPAIPLPPAPEPAPPQPPAAAESPPPAPQPPPAPLEISATVPALPVAPATERGTSPMTEACAHCSKPIPTGRPVIFCPWCGQRLVPHTCSRCGTELDSDWSHCITCGNPAKDPYRFP